MAKNGARAANIVPATAGVVHTDGELYGLSGGRRRTAALHVCTNVGNAVNVVPKCQRPADDTNASSGGGGYNRARKRRRQK